MGVVKMSNTRPETKCDNEAAEKLKHDKQSETGASTRIQQWFFWIFRPQTRFSQQNVIVFGITFEGVFELRVYLNQVSSAYI